MSVSKNIETHTTWPEEQKVVFPGQETHTTVGILLKRTNLARNSDPTTVPEE